MDKRNHRVRNGTSNDAGLIIKKIVNIKYDIYCNFIDKLWTIKIRDKRRRQKRKCLPVVKISMIKNKIISGA